jgi:hypothetical protein
MIANTKVKTQSRAVWTLLILATLVVSGFLIWNSFRSAKFMSAAAASSEHSITQAAAGEKIKLVMEIRQTGSDGLVQGTVLEKQTEKTYRRTANQVTVHSKTDTKMVMGKVEDLHAGAVVHVTGAARSDHSLDAEQIVILSGYVEVR